MIFLTFFKTCARSHAPDKYETKSFKCSPSGGRFQNKIIKSIHLCVSNPFRDEIDEAKFISIIFDETLGNTYKSQMAAVFRYVSSGKIKGGLAEFIDVSENHTAPGLLFEVMKLGKRYHFHQKLVGQAYDEAPAMATYQNGP